MKPKKTGLQVLKKIFNDWIEEKYLMNLGFGIVVCILGAPIVPYEYLKLTDVIYGYSFAYTMELEKRKAKFKFRRKDNPLKLQKIEKKILDRIMNDKRKGMKDPRELDMDKVSRKELVELFVEWENLFPKDICEWIGKEFKGEKILVVKYGYEDRGHYKEGIYFQNYCLANYKEVLKIVEEADKSFTFNLDERCKYELISPLTIFSFPILERKRGRYLLEKPFEYRSFSIELGDETEELFEITTHLNTAIQKNKRELGSLFKYWRRMSE